VEHTEVNRSKGARPVEQSSDGTSDALGYAVHGRGNIAAELLHDRGTEAPPTSPRAEGFDRRAAKPPLARAAHLAQANRSWPAALEIATTAGFFNLLSTEMAYKALADVIGAPERSSALLDIVAGKALCAAAICPGVTKIGPCPRRKETVEDSTRTSRFRL
jgi:hypothetical protein